MGVARLSWSATGCEQPTHPSGRPDSPRKRSLRPHGCPLADGAGASWCRYVRAGLPSAKPVPAHDMGVRHGVSSLNEAYPGLQRSACAAARGRRRTGAVKPTFCRPLAASPWSAPRRFLLAGRPAASRELRRRLLVRRHRPSSDVPGAAAKQSRRLSEQHVWGAGD